MGLTAKDISWYDRRLDGVEVIYRCGEFPNVPLMGVRGGINYNPVISLRQLGFALKGPPESEEVAESLLYSVDESPELMKKAAKAWHKIHYKGKTHLGKKDCVAYPPYLEWVKKMVETHYLPFPKEPPLYPQVLDQPMPVPIKRYEQLLAVNQELRAENEELSKNLHRALHEKNELAYEVKKKNELLEECNKIAEVETRKRLRISRDLGGAAVNLNDKTEALAKARYKIQKQHQEWESLMTSRKVMEDQ